MSILTSGVDALAGGVVGALARLAPEVLSILDKRNERKHEREMTELNMKFEELRHKNAVDIKDLDIEQARFTAAMPVLQTSIQAQAQQTGVKIIDALSATVRPVITYWLFFIYALVKVGIYSTYVNAGVAADQAMVALWGPEDTAMLSAVLTFWYVGRIWERDTVRDFRR
jgi:hypothetical protein